MSYRGPQPNWVGHLISEGDDGRALPSFAPVRLSYVPEHDPAKGLPSVAAAAVSAPVRLLLADLPDEGMP
jgi:hypothetical protein